MFGLAAAACCCERVPHDSYNTVCMFADVSGFTALGEAMLRKHGVGGAEYLARHLNSYFSQMVRIIAGEGGDIFKFAGDAMIVLWPDVDSVDMRCHRAAQVTHLSPDRFGGLLRWEVWRRGAAPAVRGRLTLTPGVHGPQCHCRLRAARLSRPRCCQYSS